MQTCPGTNPPLCLRTQIQSTLKKMPLIQLLWLKTSNNLGNVGSKPTKDTEESSVLCGNRVYVGSTFYANDTTKTSAMRRHLHPRTECQILDNKRRCLLCCLEALKASILPLFSQVGCNGIPAMLHCLLWSGASSQISFFFFPKSAWKKSASGCYSFILMLHIDFK